MLLLLGVTHRLSYTRRLGDALKKAISFFLAAVVLLAGAASHAADNFAYQPVGVPVTASSGLSVTLNSLTIVPKSGSTQLVISYSQRNNTVDKKIDEGSFKLFFTDGTSEPQYGFFNSFFPGDGNTRSYTWEWINGKEPWLIEWEAGFFTREPTASGLKWKVGTAYPSSGQPGELVPAPTPTPSPTPVANPGGTVLGESFSGGTITEDSLMKRKSTPYKITSTIRTRPGVTLTIEPGVQIEASGLRSAFNGLFAGAGNFSLNGSTAARISITGPELIWSPLEAQNSRFIASHVDFNQIGALLPWEAEPFSAFELRNSTIKGRTSSATKSVVFRADSFILADNTFEAIPGFELQGASKGNYEVTGNTFTGNSKTNVPSWGMKGQWVLTDLLTKFEGNYFYKFSSPVIFKLWSSNTLDARNNYFDGLSEADANKIRTLDPVKRSSGNNGDVLLSSTIEPTEPTRPRIEYSWSGTKISIEVKDVPTRLDSIKLTFKINGKWFVSQLKRTDGRFTHSENVSSVGVPMFTVDGQGVDVTQVQSKAAKQDQRTLAAYSGQNTDLTVTQRAQIRAAVDENPEAKKFICTGIRFESAPLTENLVVRKRAKLACDYAKSLNPNLSTWYQNKPTKARSYAGKVLLTVKN